MNLEEKADIATFISLVNQPIVKYIFDIPNSFINFDFSYQEVIREIPKVVVGQFIITTLSKGDC